MIRAESIGWTGCPWTLRAFCRCPLAKAAASRALRNGIPNANTRPTFAMYDPGPFGLLRDFVKSQRLEARRYFGTQGAK